MELKNYATIIELDISIVDLVLNFFPHAGVWKASVNEVPSTANSSYFNTIYNVQNIESQLLDCINIGGLSVDGDRSYIQVFDIETLYIQAKSFFLITENNIDYILVNFGITEMAIDKDVVVAQKNLFCDRFWYNENGIEINTIDNVSVFPIISNIDHSDIEGNALTFATLQTNEMSVTLSNENGRFDNFDNLYGNAFIAYQQYDYENNSKIVFSGYIEKPEYSFLELITITASDIRHSYSTTIPARSFNTDDYPDLTNFPIDVEPNPDDIVDSKRTFAAGRGITLKCTVVKYDTGSTPQVVLEICDTTDNAIEQIVSINDKYDNYILKPNVYFIDTPDDDSSSDVERETIIPEQMDFGSGVETVWVLNKEKGTLTFTGANQVKVISKGLTSSDATDYTFSDDLVDIYVQIDIPPYTGLELIQSLLANFENISYIKENYDLENFESAKKTSKEIAVLLDNDNSKSVLDLIGDVQFAEQGRLEIVNNLITWSSTKNREVKTKLNTNNMGRIDKSNDSSEYLSSCTIGYDLGSYQHENKNYEAQAKKKHRITSHEDFDTILKNKTDAQELSNEIMESRYTLKDYYTFEYFNDLDGLELFDLVEIEYKRIDGSYFIKPCVCEIVKLNIFDDILKLRKIYDL